MPFSRVPIYFAFGYMRTTSVEVSLMALVQQNCTNLKAVDGSTRITVSSVYNRRRLAFVCFYEKKWWMNVKRHG